jgi:hypothetical protein
MLLGYRFIRPCARLLASFSTCVGRSSLVWDDGSLIILRGDRWRRATISLWCFSGVWGGAYNTDDNICKGVSGWVAVRVVAVGCPKGFWK